jgi:hypothetical protein
LISLPGKQFFYDSAARGQHFLNLRRILPACFGKIGSSTAAAANERRDPFDHLARGDSFREIGRDADDNHDLPVGRRGEDDDTGLDAGSMLVNE